MKLNKTTFLALAASAFMLTSCVDDDLEGLDAQPKSTATTTITSLTLVEGESGIIPFTINRPISKASQFKIEIVSGDAVQSDFSAGDQTTDGDTGIPGVGFEITVPAYSESFDIPVQAIADIYPEGSETVELRISTAGVRTILADVNVTLNIENSASEELAVLLEWENNVTYKWLETVTEEDGDDTDVIISEETEDLCSVVDFDLIAYPGGYLAGTAACPEEDLGIAVIPDGTYQIVVDLYDVSPSHDPITPFALPYKLTIGKKGTFIATVEYDDVYTSDSATSFPGGAGPGQTLAATLVVAGGSYTVYDRDDNLVAAE